MHIKQTDIRWNVARSYLLCILQITAWVGGNIRRKQKQKTRETRFSFLNPFKLLHTVTFQTFLAPPILSSSLTVSSTSSGFFPLTRKKFSFSIRVSQLITLVPLRRAITAESSLSASCALIAELPSARPSDDLPHKAFNTGVRVVKQAGLSCIVLLKLFTETFPRSSLDCNHLHILLSKFEASV